MPNIAYPPRRPLSVGEVLDLTFQIYRASVLRCLLLAAVGVVLGQTATIYTLAKGRGLGSGGWQGFIQALQGDNKDPVYWAAYVFGALAPLVFYAAILLRQHAIITARPLGGELAAALRRAPALLGASLLVLASLGACFLPALLLSPPARYGLAVLCLIPLSYVLLMLSCTLVVLILSGTGPIASYARSWRLTSGSFWRLSAIYTVGMIVLIVFFIVLGMLAAFMSGILGRGDVALIAATAGVITVAVTALTTPYYTAMGLAVFGDLSARKEGADLEQRIAASA
jgi:hypothetical protein